MASPVVVTVVTLLAATCSLKTLYGSVIVVGCAGAKSTFVMNRLAASRTSSVIQNRLDRNGFGAGGTGTLGTPGSFGVRSCEGPGEAAMSPRNPTPLQIAASTTARPE